MASSYRFSDLAKFSGATHNNITHWVQTGLIRPDLGDTRGTGEHRKFGFLDVFEACVAHRLNQLPGGMPIAHLSLALDAIQYETSAGEAWGTPWGRFLDPTTRDADAQFWLWQSWNPLIVPRVVETREREALFKDLVGPVVLANLHALLLGLEQKTDDHSTAAERDAAWMKKRARPRRSKQLRVDEGRRHHAQAR